MPLNNPIPVPKIADKPRKPDEKASSAVKEEYHKNRKAYDAKVELFNQQRNNPGSLTKNALTDFNQPLRKKWETKAKTAPKKKLMVNQTHEEREAEAKQAAEKDYLEKNSKTTSLSAFKENGFYVFQAHYDALTSDEQKIEQADREALDKSHAAVEEIFKILKPIGIGAIAASAISAESRKKLKEAVGSDLDAEFKKITVSGEQSLAYVKLMISALNMIVGYPGNGLLDPGWGHFDTDKRTINRYGLMIAENLKALCEGIDRYYNNKYRVDSSLEKSDQVLAALLDEPHEQSDALNKRLTGDTSKLTPEEIASMREQLVKIETARVASGADEEIKALDERIAALEALSEQEIKESQAPALSFSTAIGDYSSPPPPTVAQRIQSLNDKRSELDNSNNVIKRRLEGIKERLSAIEAANKLAEEKAVAVPEPPAPALAEVKVAGELQTNLAVTEPEPTPAEQNTAGEVKAESVTEEPLPIDKENPEEEFKVVLSPEPAPIAQNRLGELEVSLAVKEPEQSLIKQDLEQKLDEGLPVVGSEPASTTPASSLSVVDPPIINQRPDVVSVPEKDEKAPEPAAEEKVEEAKAEIRTQEQTEVKKEEAELASDTASNSLRAQADVGELEHKEETVVEVSPAARGILPDAKLKIPPPAEVQLHAQPTSDEAPPAVVELPLPVDEREEQPVLSVEEPSEEELAKLKLQRTQATARGLFSPKNVDQAPALSAAPGILSSIDRYRRAEILQFVLALLFAVLFALASIYLAPALLALMPIAAASIAVLGALGFVVGAQVGLIASSLYLNLADYKGNQAQQKSDLRFASLYLPIALGIVLGVITVLMTPVPLPAIAFVVLGGALLAWGLTSAFYNIASKTFAAGIWEKLRESYPSQLQSMLGPTPSLVKQPGTDLEILVTPAPRGSASLKEQASERTPVVLLRSEESVTSKQSKPSISASSDQR